MPSDLAKRAYEIDVDLCPTYDDGTPRKTWEQLNERVRQSWMRNPTPRIAVTKDFLDADDAWSAELQRRFGVRAGAARYTPQGKGESGSALRVLHDAREAARVRYEAAITALSCVTEEN